jgi:hypothetical protein
MEAHAKFAGRVKGAISFSRRPKDSGRDRNFGDIINLLTSIQGHLTTSDLSEDDRLAFWTPIAECYSKVRAALVEHLRPLEERRLLTLGDTIILESTISLSGNDFIVPKFDRYQFAIENPDPGEGAELSRVSFATVSYGYICKLPANVIAKLETCFRTGGPRTGIMDLPLKVVTVGLDIHDLPFVAFEIDEAAFLEM